jgi:hypothetical protein
VGFKYIDRFLIIKNAKKEKGKDVWKERGMRIDLECEEKKRKENQEYLTMTPFIHFPILFFTAIRMALYLEILT